MKEFERHQKVDALKLTDIQKAFAERYVEHFNKSRAVKESGSKAMKTSMDEPVHAVKRERMAIAERKQLLDALQLPFEQFFQRRQLFGRLHTADAMAVK